VEWVEAGQMALFARIVVRSLSTWKSGKKGTTESTLRHFAAYLRLKRCETSIFGEKFVSFCVQLFCGLTELIAERGFSASVPQLGGYMRQKTGFMLCISPSSLSPFSVHVSMECRFSDRGDLVAEATASFHHIHP